MSSLSAVTNSAMSSLLASQLELSVASNNISNAQTPGYSRQRVNLAPSAAAAGVEVVDIQALRDQLTSNRLNLETSYRSAQDTMQQTLQDIQSTFNDPQGTGLLSKVTSFFNSFQTLSNDPTSMTNREFVQQAGQSLANAFHSQAANLNNQQQTANQTVATDVNKINSLTSQIATITQHIQEEEAPDQPQNSLRDQRSQLVQQLSQLVDAREIESNGTYEVSLGSSGQTLVINGVAQNLSVGTGANGLYSVDAGNIDITSGIGGGDLQGQLQLRDQKISSYQNQLDQLAYQITQQVNTIHSAAYDLNGNTGANFFAPLSSASGAAGAIALSSAVAGNTQAIAASQNGAAGNNVAALAIGNLLHNPVFNGGSVTDQYSSLVFSIGNDTANAQAAFKEHDALFTQLQNQLQSISGVSIDEETAQILQFQRSFQASSKVISAVDQMLQTALSMTGAAG
jgi:flagellar hook-associated protein 1 FlgK